MKTKQSKLERFMDALLKEDTIPETPKNPQEFAPVQAPQDVSLDQIVDRYLIRYEKESIPTVDNYEEEIVGESAHYGKVLDYLLTEAPGDPGEEDVPAEDDAGGDLNLDAPEGGADASAAPGGAEGGELPDAGGDAGLDLGTGAEDDSGGAPQDDGSSEEQDTKAVMGTPQINLQNFARSVARLVNNYEVLVNPKNTILNRVNAYVKSNYDERTAKELMDMLSTNFSLRTQDQQEQQSAELDRQSPLMAGASGDPG